MNNILREPLAAGRKTSSNSPLLLDSVRGPVTDLPARLHGPVCWESDTPDASQSSYIRSLTASHIASIAEAISHFKNLSKPLPFLSPQTFPIPAELEDILGEIKGDVHQGTGFGVLRGLDPQHYSDEEMVIAYCGLASYVGAERVTNAFGMSMDHLRNAEGDAIPANQARMKLNKSKLSEGMKFHTDRYYAEIVSMFIKENSARGGEQYLASFPTIYNRMMEQEPESLQVLARDWNWPNDSVLNVNGPVVFNADGGVLVQLAWQAFLDDPRFLSHAQTKALNTVQTIAEHVCIELDHQAGDIQFVNNLTILHARNAFQNSAQKNRHIMRMGLRDPKYSCALPRLYRQRTDFAFVPPKKQTIPVHDYDPYLLTTVANTACHHG